MRKTNKIVYWVSTLWLALGMTSTGIVQLLGTQDEVNRMTHLGFPAYSLAILGIWKLLGVMAVLIPKYRVVKEWAYAGFFFTMTGAMYCHISLGDPAREIFPSLLLLVLTVVSWYFRPAERKLMLNTSTT
jgi:hypothetical protein